VTLALQNAPESSLELADLTISFVNFEIGIAKFELEFHLWEEADQIMGQVDYYKELFEPTTIVRMLGHFKTLLASIAANPTWPISEYSLLNDSERHQLLVEWNNTKADYPFDKCIHQLFEEQVDRMQEAVAVVFENQQLTYQELNTKANQLAHYLRTLGVKPDILVGICIERSFEMVIGLLGILKAGGAYVPLDPNYPYERLAFMLEDSQISVLLTQQKVVEGLQAAIKNLNSKIQNGQNGIICLDTDWRMISQLQPSENLVTEVQYQNLAYVIYTSGSTGIPKGVMIPHQAISNHTFWMQNAFPLSENDKVLQKTPFSFDASVWEFYAPLLVGAQLIMAMPEGHKDPAYLVTVIVEQQITTLQLVPSLLQLFIKQEGFDTCHSLRNLFCGGEVLPFALIEPCFASLNADLHNLYGPTEACIDATFWTVQKNYQSVAAPIGSPIANTQIYILDPNHQPTPIGVPGELYIGGAGLGRGYLNSPELTAEKFVPNPFSEKLGSRLYKTGDLVRYLPNGSIEYLDRIDNQVKIRGLRIELGEIEALLTQHPKVQEAVVITHQDVSGNIRLVAYLVSDTTLPPNASELRGFLKDKLPDYMIPAFFLWLDVLPLTPSGKIDRRAFPAPETLISPTDGQYVAPRTATEEILASIWAEVLGLKQVSIFDNFFERGGDSILSIQVVTRANKAGLQLTPKLIFQHQTIAELVTKIGPPLTRQAEQGLVTGDVPLTPIQQWFFEQNFPEPHHYNQAMLFESTTYLNPTWLERIVQHWFVHHDALRLRFTKGDSIWHARQVGLEKEIPFQIVDLSNVPPHTQSYALEKVAAQQQASLNLSEGPLMRVVLFNLGTPCRLFIVIHHLAIDGVSWHILLEDLQTAYHQLSRGEVIQWSPKTTSFQAWSYQLAEYAQSPAVVSELDYWLSLTEATPLPIEISPQPGLTSSTHSLSITVASMVHLTVSLTAEQTHALLNEVPAVYNTHINDVLMTALVQSFAQWTGQKTLLIDLEGHGREDLFEEVDLSRTVGWFTSLFPVLLDLRFATSVGEALKSIKEQLRRIPHHGINYGLLRYLNSETSAQLQNLLQAQVCFNYLGQFGKMVSGDSLLRFATEETGPIHSLLGNRPYLFEINGAITEGQLQLDWSYSEDFHQRATVEKLAQDFIKALENLIAHCQSPEAGGYTPSDFAAAELSQDELDELLDEID
jgi:amino acid adenylation domain-containing protein/non-ribosomal peptide synthase protein (TIGR01720 family)